MTLPLYKAATQPSRSSGDHAGLWFDKFCNHWHVTCDSWTMSGEQKLMWIKSLANDRVGATDQIDEFASRLRRLVKRRDGRFEVFTTESRFVTGLGRSHPVENGFAWHPTLGTPFLPGSSVKGLIRSWAKMDAEPHPSCKTLDRLLGQSEETGGVCFLDAVPDAPVQLEPDVMTPHYAGWDEKNPPGDWRSPTPIPFLTTAAGTSFLFGFIPCRGATKKEDLDTIAVWLRSALEWAGAGAKTAVGYGRFRPGKVTTTPSLQQAPQSPHTRRGVEPKPGDRVQAELLEEKTRRGGWKAKHPESGLQGPIQDTDNVPADAKPGHQVELTVAYVRANEIAFKWGTPC